MSCAILGNRLLPWHLCSFDCVFTRKCLVINTCLVMSDFTLPNQIPWEKQIMKILLVLYVCKHPSNEMFPK